MEDTRPRIPLRDGTTRELTDEEISKIMVRRRDIFDILALGVFEGDNNPLLLLDMNGTIEWCTMRATSEVCGIINVYTGHYHRCIDYPTCDGEWKHDPMDTFFRLDDSYQHSHDCPKCGKINNHVFYPEGQEGN